MSNPHKDRQVCRQVYDALNWALADVDDPLLEDLALVAVDPAPDASRVIVTFVMTRADIDPDAVRAHLAELLPELRAEVAAELTRRRVPELTFRVTPAST
jgi:ribosome-binding factor A